MAAWFQVQRQSHIYIALPRWPDIQNLKCRPLNRKWKQLLKGKRWQSDINSYSHIFYHARHRYGTADIARNLPTSTTLNHFRFNSRHFLQAFYTFYKLQNNYGIKNADCFLHHLPILSSSVTSGIRKETCMVFEQLMILQAHYWTTVLGPVFSVRG